MAKKTQIQKFREAARQAGADESEERFNATLKDLAKKSPAKRGNAGQTDPSKLAKPKH